MPCLNNYLPFIKRTVTITPADWDEQTKIATVTIDWAVEGMSVSVNPIKAYMDMFKSVDVQGVYCIEIFNGYIQFVTGTRNVIRESIELELTAYNDGRGEIVNATIVSAANNGIELNTKYDVVVENGEGRINGINPEFKWETPPYDNEGHELTALGAASGNFNNVGGSVFNGAFVTELYLKNNIKEVVNYAMQKTTILKKIYIGKNVTYMGYNNVFRNSTGLKEIEFETPRMEPLIIETSSNNYAFGECTSLEKLYIPSNVIIKGACFANCSSLKTMRFGAGVALENWNNVSFGGGLAVDDFTFEGNAPLSYFGTIFNGWAISAPFTAGKHIFVPYESLTVYSTTTNWVSYASYMNGIGTFTAGATLPTETTDGNWNLTWYATKADLKAGINPITVAPDEFDNEYGEIYCVKTAAE